MGTNLMQFKDDLSQNNWHVFVIFLIYNFRLLFAAAVLFCHAACSEETIRFLVFKVFFTCAFHFYFPMLSQVLFLMVKKWKFCFSVSFC